MSLLRSDMNRYINQIFQSNIIQQQIDKNCSATINQITKNDFKQFLIALPPLPEQKAIAEALSDADGLIASLEKLIEKKKAIKQGAMQQLLTGKKRLPGFSGEWVEKTLKDILSVGHGQSQHEIADQRGKYPILATSGVIGWTNYYLWDKPSVLIGRKGTINKPQYIDTPFWTIDTLFYTKIYEGNSAKYLYYLFCLIDWLQYNEASGVPSLNANTIESIEVYLPQYLEQTAIANILTDMDAEIEALQKKLAKARLIKQGMMQELLTGRIRLVDTEDKAKPQATPVTVAKKEQSRQGRNKHIEDAVLIAAIVDTFYSDKYPLGRVKIQKLLYLLRRKQEASVADFKKKAAGPYADEIRYKGGEPIAIKNKYIVTSTSKKGTRYSKGEYIAQALGYIEKWDMQDDINWLKNNFLHTGRNELELLATIDMAMCDLTAQGKEISIANIKELIRSDKEWNAKLKKAYFSDVDIQRAIKENTRLFG